MRKPRSKRYVGSLLAGWGLMCASLWCVGSAGAQDTCLDPNRECHDFAYVTDWNNNLVQVVDIDAPAGQELVASVAVGDSPADIKASSDGNRMYVSNHGANTVSVIDTGASTGSITKIADIAVGEKPEGVGVKSSRVYVANTNSDTVSVIDEAQLAVVATLAVGRAPGQIAAHPSANTVYVTNRGSNTVSVIDCGSNTVAASMEAGKFPWGIALSPDGSMVCVTNLSSSMLGWISAGGGSLYATGTVGIAPYNVVIHPSYYMVYVANADDGTVSLLYGSWLWQTISTMTIQTGAQWGPYDVALTYNADKLLVPTFSGGTLNVYNSIAGSLIRSISLGGAPRAVTSIRRYPSS
jgi:YVTN family beta-propeller protein